MPDIPAIALIHAHHRHQMLQNMAPPEAETDPDIATQTKTGADFVAQLDTDADGGLSAAEFEESTLGKIADDAAFAKIDSDGDGMLSAEEVDLRHAEVAQARADRTPAALAMLIRPSIGE